MKICINKNKIKIVFIPTIDCLDNFLNQINSFGNILY